MDAQSSHSKAQHFTNNRLLSKIGSIWSSKRTRHIQTSTGQKYEFGDRSLML